MKKIILIALLGFIFQACNDDPIVDTSANMLTDITSKAQFDDQLSEGVSFIFYHASWCTKCKAQRPAVEAVSEDEDYPDVFFGEVEYEDFPSIVDDRNIPGFPTMVIYKDNVEQKRFSGQGHTEQQFKDALDEALKAM